MPGKRDLRLFGLDAVNGSLDLYHFEQLPGERELLYIETRNCTEPLLDEAEANKIVDAKVLRLLFSTGFFRMRNLQINAEPVAGEIIYTLLGRISRTRDAGATGGHRCGAAQAGGRQGAAIAAGLADLDPDHVSLSS